ncbi:MAG: large subunit ribosomal protein [Acidobacteriota bacterium]|jgi:large subunit ribosomal protein L17|nr:large subunit ribosomal protein [Acidobacteriota bacterium]
MRHAVKGRKLGRTSSHREALFRNQLQSLVEKEKIITTLPKAKELRPIAERVITRGKHGTLHDRRWVLRWVLKRDLVKKVFDDIAPRFTERPGGYLRIVKLGPRQGDGAEMAVLELVEREATAAPEPEQPKKAKEPKPKKEAKDSKADEAKPKPKRESKKDAPKKVSTKKEGRAQVSTPKKSV